MSWIDIGILGILLISAIVSLFRGFFKEVISLLTWVAALWLAFAFSDVVAAMLPQSLDNTTFSLFGSTFDVSNMRRGIAFVALFVGTLIVGAIINLVMGRATQNRVLRGSDRFLGIVFGLARGGVIVTLLVLLSGLTNLPRSPAWDRSQLLDPFYRAALWTRDAMPERYSHYVTFPQDTFEAGSPGDSGNQPAE